MCHILYRSAWKRSRRHSEKKNTIMFKTVITYQDQLNAGLSEVCEVHGIDATVAVNLYNLWGLIYKMLHRNRPKFDRTILSWICVRLIHRMNVRTENVCTRLFQM